MLWTVKQFAKRTPLVFLVRWLRRSPARQQPSVDPVTQQHLDNDRDTVAVIRRVLKSSSVAIDVGGHAGAILREIIAAAPLGKHHAFEPLPHLAAQLRVAFPSVQIHQQAVGDTPGNATFRHVVNDPGYSGLRPRAYDRPDPIFEELIVEVVKLDDVITSDEAVAFIKLDIEGGEYHALRGALATIRRCRPVIVFEAALRSTGCYGVSAGDLFDLITNEMNYSLWTLRAWLAGQSPYSRESFEENWQCGREYYFVAAPAKSR